MLRGPGSPASAAGRPIATRTDEHWRVLHRSPWPATMAQRLLIADSAAPSAPLSSGSPARAWPLTARGAGARPACVALDPSRSRSFARLCGSLSTLSRRRHSRDGGVPQARVVAATAAPHLMLSTRAPRSAVLNLWMPPVRAVREAELVRPSRPARLRVAVRLTGAVLAISFCGRARSSTAGMATSAIRAPQAR